MLGTVFEISALGNTNCSQLEQVFKNEEIDDFKNLFDSTILKAIMGILFVIVVIFKNFEELLIIDVGHP